MALHRADVHGFETQVGKEIPMPFGMMPIVTQKMVKTLTVALKYIHML